MAATIEQTLIAQAGHTMIKAMGQTVIATEIQKGCEPGILPQPTALEPTYWPITTTADGTAQPALEELVVVTPPTAKELCRYRIWISPEQSFNWQCGELFLRHLSAVSHRIGWEIVGNAQHIVIILLCHRQDVPVVTTAFQAKFPQCRLSPLANPLDRLTHLNPKSPVKLYDYFPPPPYHHRLTGPQDLYMSPYESVLTALAQIPASGWGLLQLLFQPVAMEHNWHANVKTLMDFDYFIRLASDPGPVPRYPQQLPSGDLRHMASETETKAHNDKSFYFAACRLAVFGNLDHSQMHLNCLDTFARLFQHSGRSLEHLTHEDYGDILTDNQILEMFQLGLTYRSGFLVNAAELSGLVHVPPAQIFEPLTIHTDTLDPLALFEQNLSEGTPIGHSRIADRDHRVCISPKIRSCHTHLIGKPRMGKSTLIEHMVLNDIQNGHGVAVLDPHGDLVERLLYLLPIEVAERVIYFDPGDPYWIPIWNPMQRIAGQDIGRMTDDLVSVFKSFVTGWGDRMEHLLRHAMFALLHLSRSNLRDVADLLRRGSKESETLRHLILEVVQNDLSRQFWQHDFTSYQETDFGPAQHKLSKLLLADTTNLMLSQPDSAFNFHQIMDEGLIFLGNLSNLGSEQRNVLGGFLVSIMYMTALSRSDQPNDQRQLYHIFLDEAHRFVTDSLEDILTETCKYDVSMTLAHQNLHQFDSSKKINALGNVGSTVVFNVDSSNATLLAKNFKKKIKVEDFVSLEIGDAIVRCRTDIVKIRTPEQLEISTNHARDRILDYSRAHYCRPIANVLQLINRKNERAHKPFTPLTLTKNKTTENVSANNVHYHEL